MALPGSTGSTGAKKKKPAKVGMMAKEVMLKSPGGMPNMAKQMKSAVSAGKVAKAKAKTRKVLKASGLSKRQKGVIKTGAREITQGNKPISTTRFIRSAAKDIAGSKGKGYKQALVRSAAKTTTKAEAKGVKKVLSRKAKRDPRQR